MPNFDPTREEMISHLEKNAFTDVNGYMNYEIEAAIYWFANYWHGGQWTNLYSVLSTSPYKPGPITRLESEGEIVEILYNELEAEFTPHD